MCEYSVESVYLEMNSHFLCIFILSGERATISKNLLFNGGGVENMKKEGRLIYSIEKRIIQRVDWKKKENNYLKKIKKSFSLRAI